MIFLLAACETAPHWEKAGGNDVAMSEDLQQCRVHARISPQESVLAMPTTQGSSSPMIDRGQERDAQENQRIRECMQARGYNLKR